MDSTRRYRIVSGEITTDYPTEGFYIYQDIHTVGYRALDADKHLAILNSSAEALFGKRLLLDAKELERQIARLLEANKPSRIGSVKVRLTSNANGGYTLRNSEATIYDGYTMRSLRPTATYIEMTTPDSSHSTSAMEQCRELAEAMARRAGCDKGVICNAERIVADVAYPLVALGGKTLLTHPTTLLTVEGERIAVAAEKRGYKVRTREVTKADLKRAEEVFLLDWQGTLPLGRLSDRIYTNIAIESLTREVTKELKQR